MSYGGAGMVILDISDISLPQLVGQLRHHPPFAGKLTGARCHTVLPLSGRDYAVMTSEGERFHVYSQRAGHRRARSRSTSSAWSTSPTRPTRRSSPIFPYPEIPAGYPYKNFNEIPGWGVGPFGPHNIHEPHYHPALEDRQRPHLLLPTSTRALRVYDISDPFVPRRSPTSSRPTRRRGSSTTPPAISSRARLMATTEDVLVDNRGNIFVDTSARRAVRAALHGDAALSQRSTCLDIKV